MFYTGKLANIGLSLVNIFNETTDTIKVEVGKIVQVRSTLVETIRRAKPSYQHFSIKKVFYMVSHLTFLFIAGFKI